MHMSFLVLKKGQLVTVFKINARFPTKQVAVKLKVENLTVNERWSCFFSNLTSFLEKQDQHALY